MIVFENTDSEHRTNRASKQKTLFLNGNHRVEYFSFWKLKSLILILKSNYCWHLSVYFSEAVAEVPRISWQRTNIAFPRILLKEHCHWPCGKYFQSNTFVSKGSISSFLKVSSKQWNISRKLQFCQFFKYIFAENPKLEFTPIWLKMQITNIINLI